MTTKPVNKHIPILFQSLDKYELDENDLRFQKVKIWLCHVGENLNGSYFSEESIEDAKPSLANTPILAYVEKNSLTGKEDFSDHREILIRKDGEVTTKYLGKPIGVIPADNNAQFENRLCDDGETRKYLTVEGLVWTKLSDSTDIMNRDIIKAQSMELSDEYDGQFEDDGLFHFSKFQFYGACALGYGVQPAMKNSTIELQFSVNNFKDEVNGMMELFKTNFTSNANTDEQIDDQNIDLQFEQKEEERQVKTKTEIAKSFALTIGQLSTELSRVLSKETFTAESYWGDAYETSKYYMQDFDEEFVYVVDREADYKNFKIPYTKNGDDVSFSFDNKVRVKNAFVDWVDGNGDEEVAVDFTKIVVDEHKKYATEKVEKLEAEVSTKNDNYIELDTKFTSTKDEIGEKEAKITELEEEIVKLNEFKAQISKQERNQKVEALFEKVGKNFSSDELNEWREKESQYEDVTAFEKDLKAFAFDKLVEKNSDEKVEIPKFTQMQVDETDTKEKQKAQESNDVFERLQNNN